MKKQIYFGCLNMDDIEFTLTLKNGDRIEVSDMHIAVLFIEGIYKDQVEKLEAKTIYSVIKSQ